jgi:5,10-methenyltetrahydrofolate synthetase
VIEAMMPYLTGHWHNPSSSYAAAREVRAAVETAREQVASLIGAHPDEIVFTGSGTEANSTVIKSLAREIGRAHSRVVISAIEHSAVIRPVEAMAAVGFEVERAGVKEDGRLDLAAFAALPGEPDLHPFDWCHSKSVLLPRVEGDHLIFHAVKNPAQLKPGTFGVLEPDPTQGPVADPATADTIFVPGLAFTAEGHRLGRGRGYYDRLLSTLPETILRVGVCFNCQLVDSIPQEPHDEFVDLVLSSPA